MFYRNRDVAVHHTQGGVEKEEGGIEIQLYRRGERGVDQIACRGGVAVEMRWRKYKEGGRERWRGNDGGR